MKAWLTVHDKAPEAQFVYDAWLDAGGDRAVVADGVKAWLTVHGETADASHVYKAWLDVNGEIHLVQPMLYRWLTLHRNLWDASFVIKSIARHNDLPSEVVAAMFDWCTAFSTNEEALTKFTLLMPYAANRALAKHAVPAFHAIAENLHLINPSNTFWIQAAEMTCENNLIALENCTWLCSQIREFFHACLRHPCLFLTHAPDRQKPNFGHILWRIRRDLTEGHLDSIRDRNVLIKLARWHAYWPQNDRQILQGTLTILRSDFPMDGLWDDI